MPIIPFFPAYKKGAHKARSAPPACFLLDVAGVMPAHAGVPIAEGAATLA